LILVLAHLLAQVSKSGPDPVWGIGLGVGLFVLSAPMLWAALNLRSKTHSRLRSSVDIAFAGLSEQTVIKLRLLQSQLDTLLPSRSEAFDPLTLIVDPAKIEQPAKRAIRILRQRSRVVRQFEFLLLVCSIARYVAGAFTTLVAVSTLLYFFTFTLVALWLTSCWIAAAVGIFGIVVVIMYSILVNRIQQAIEAADPIENAT
jgi:hypothetical protein